MNSPRILIVEDESIVALNLQNILENLGYEVPAVVASGEEALVKTADLRPDLVLMDIQLQGEMDGVEAATQIHSHFGIPLIYITANSDDTTFRQAKAAAPSGYILKPIDKKELHMTIDLALARHRQAEETRLLLASIVESSHDAIISVDLEGAITTWNKGAAKIYGYKASEACGQQLSILDPPEDEGATERLLARSRAGERVEQHETLRRRADGNLIHISLTCSPIYDARGHIVALSSIDRDITESRRAAKELQRARDHLEQRVRERTAELQSAMSRLEREIAERHQAEQELVRLERLHALGELAAGVSHNLNNLLVGILAPAEALLRCTDLRDIREWAQLILETGQRATTLVQRLNRSVRPQSGELLQSVQAELVVQEAVQATRPRWKDEPESRGIQIDLVTELEKLPPVRASYAGLHDILVNLLLNAVDALPQGGTIRIHAYQQEDQVTLQVCDNGIGMDEETRRRIFEPFFTTKADVGSGLGLAIAYKAVSSWGGHIEVESALQEGTCIRLLLPVWHEEPLPSTVESLPGKNNRVLVLEDDEHINLTLRKHLSARLSLDFAVSGPQALECFLPEAHSIVLVDWGVPGMTGDLVARRLRQRCPSVVIVLMTGWLIDENHPHLDIFDFRLQKPFTLAEIDRMLTRAAALYQSRTSTS